MNQATSTQRDDTPGPASMFYQPTRLLQTHQQAPDIAQHEKLNLIFAVVREEAEKFETKGEQISV